jgi:hypothetical protein
MASFIRMAATLLPSSSVTRVRLADASSMRFVPPLTEPVKATMTEHARDGRLHPFRHTVVA